MAKRFILDILFPTLLFCIVLLILNGLSFDSVFHLLAIFILFTVAYIDFKKRLIPNYFVVILFVVRLMSFIFGVNPSLLNSLIDFLFVFLAILIIILVSNITHKDSIVGGGDIKLLIVLALYLSFDNNLFALLLMCLLTLVTSAAMKSKTIPLAIPIAFAYSITFCFQNILALT